MTNKIIQQGAEAVILKKGDLILKKRIKKSYRIDELDEKIRKLRTRSETNLLERASKIIPIPKVIKSDEKSKEIDMEFIDGKKLSESLDNFKLEKQKQVCREIGKSVAKLHDSGIIHGDLTTSNMILKEEKTISHEQKIKGRSDNGKLGSLYFIDFGLGFMSNKIEDKAVDIHLLKQALEAKHFQNWKALFKEVIKSYKNSRDYNLVIERLEKVEKRRRYRH